MMFLKSNPPLIASNFKVIFSWIEIFPNFIILQPSPIPAVLGILIGPNVSPNSVVPKIFPSPLYDEISAKTL